MQRCSFCMHAYGDQLCYSLSLSESTARAAIFPLSLRLNLHVFGTEEFCRNFEGILFTQGLFPFIAFGTQETSTVF
jgi:hypothetical protein